MAERVGHEDLDDPLVHRRLDVGHGRFDHREKRVAARRGLEPVHQRRHQPRHVGPLPGERDHAGQQPFEVQDVLEHLGETGGPVDHRVHELPLFFDGERPEPLLERSRSTEDHRHRRAKLVGHRGDERAP